MSLTCQYQCFIMIISKIIKFKNRSLKTHRNL
nr:MAG TPA: hypothetical protein [Caudoviricetes sp.]